LFITAPVSVAREMKKRTPEEKAKAGWDKYQDILDRIPPG